MTAQLDYLAGRISRGLASILYPLIRQEFKPMVDVVADLTAQVQATLSTLQNLVSVVQQDTADLAAAQASGNTAAIETLIGNLKSGTDAASAALLAAQAALQPAPAASPAPAAPAAPVESAAQPATADPAPATPEPAAGGGSSTPTPPTA